MKRTLVTFFAFLLLLHSFAFAQSKPKLKGIDLFGSNQIDVRQIQSKFADKIQKIVSALYVDNDFDLGMNLRQEVISAIRQMGKFAYVELSAVLYPNKDVYVTVDLVDESDRSVRIQFSAPPQKELADPDGLLALWEEYENIAQALWRKGELNFEKMACPALHCSYGFEHPDLKKYEQPFQAKVPTNTEALVRILREDKDAQHRRNAAFLLAHIQDPVELTQILLPSISDPDETVRNNAMRVLGEIAEKRKQVTIPVEPIIKALNYPATTDRNKALYVLEGLADNPANKVIIIGRASKLLVRLLKLSQPNNHDFAYSILKKISGKNFAERDYKSWEQWVEKV
jgi:HEAT repeat protein